MKGKIHPFGTAINKRSGYDAIKPTYDVQRDSWGPKRSIRPEGNDGPRVDLRELLDKVDSE